MQCFIRDLYRCAAAAGALRAGVVRPVGESLVGAVERAQRAARAEPDLLPPNTST